jgi:hypothetical protein
LEPPREMLPKYRGEVLEGRVFRRGSR